MKYNPELTCLLQGGKNVVDTGFLDVTGGSNGKSVILDVALLAGDDAYEYPAKPADRRRQGRTGWQTGLWIAARRGQELARALSGDELRVGHGT